MMRFSQKRRDRKDGRATVPVIAFFLFLALLLPTAAVPADWAPLIDRLVADGFDESSVRSLFARPEIQFDHRVMTRKVESLMKNRHFGPVTGVRKYKAVYEGFMRPAVIAGARSYLQENNAVLEKARARYGVPKEIIVSILLVETRLGEYVGERYAFNTLASMALCTDLESVRPYLLPDLLKPDNEDYARSRIRQKSDWAYHELKALIIYAAKSGLDPATIPGSFYGAIGICQFMPSHAMNFGVDADRDGRVDLFSGPDAFYSIANYLRGNGWKPGRMSRERKHRVIRAYNPSNVYANTVLAVAGKLSVKVLAKKPAKRKAAPQPVNPA